MFFTLYLDLVEVYVTVVCRVLYGLMYTYSQLRPEIYRCNLCWKDDKTLLIGWGDMIKVCVVKERVDQEVRDLPNRYVEIGKLLGVFIKLL